MKAHACDELGNGVVVAEGDLRLALADAAECGAWSSTAYSVAIKVQAIASSILTVREVVAWRGDTQAAEVDLIIERWLAELGGVRSDELAPLAWAMQEVAEWLGERARVVATHCEDDMVGLTWRPASPSDVVADVVEQRLTLLREELADFGVQVTELSRIGHGMTVAVKDSGPARTLTRSTASAR